MIKKVCTFSQSIFSCYFRKSILFCPYLNQKTLIKLVFSSFHHDVYGLWKLHTHGFGYLVCLYFRLSFTFSYFEVLLGGRGRGGRMPHLNFHLQYVHWSGFFLHRWGWEAWTITCWSSDTNSFIQMFWGGLK